MVFNSAYCRRVILILVLCNYQQSSIQEDVLADNTDSPLAQMPMTKEFNNLIDVFRKNWESPMAYLIQRGYIPMSVAQPDKKSRDTIKKMQKEYGEPEDSEEKVFRFLQKISHGKDCNLKVGNQLDSGLVALLKAKNMRRNCKKHAGKLPCDSNVIKMKCYRVNQTSIQRTKTTTSTTTTEATTCANKTLTNTTTTTTTCSSPTSSTSSSTTTTTSKPCEPKSTTSECPSKTTRCPHTAKSTTPPAQQNETCDEYYEDVLECYEDDDKEFVSTNSSNSPPMITMTTTTTPTSTTTTTTTTTNYTLPNTTKPNTTKPNYTLPNTTKPSSLKHYKFDSDRHMSSPLMKEEEDDEIPTITEATNIETQIDDPAFELATIVAKNTVQNYLKNGYFMPKAPKLESTQRTGGFNLEDRFKRAKNAAFVPSLGSVLPQHVSSWQFQPSYNMRGGMFPNENIYPQKDDRMINQNRDFPNTFRAKEHNIIQNVEAESDMSKLTNNNFERFTDFNTKPLEDSGQVSLNAVYVGDKQNNRNLCPALTDQPFDNLEQSKETPQQSSRIFERGLPFSKNFKGYKKL